VNYFNFLKFTALISCLAPALCLAGEPACKESLQRLGGRAQLDMERAGKDAAGIPPVLLLKVMQLALEIDSLVTRLDHLPKPNNEEIDRATIQVQQEIVDKVRQTNLQLDKIEEYENDYERWTAGMRAEEKREFDEALSKSMLEDQR